MANVKNLKKDINYVLGDIIEAVMFGNMQTQIKILKKAKQLLMKQLLLLMS